MTEEEADALDELLTKTTPKLGPNGTGFFARNRDYLVILDDFSAGYVHSCADATHKTPTEIIGDLVRKELRAAGRESA
jgi:hypothetical protein